MSDAAAAVDPDCRGIPPQTTVIKIGGSVLTGTPAYRRAARFIADRLRASPRRVVVVVSAERGLTDALLRSAQEFGPTPDPNTLDLLWSTGELRSVALLTLALHALGVRAHGLNVHESGMAAREAQDGRERTSVRSLRLRSLLARSSVLVIPGFLARGAGDRIVSLGRGGSDLSAVALAAGLEAEACELVKDVPGYFSANPHRNSEATHLDTIDYEQALDMADHGCELVQRDALLAARARNITLVVRAIGKATVTRVVRKIPDVQKPAISEGDEARRSRAHEVQRIHSVQVGSGGSVNVPAAV